MKLKIWICIRPHLCEALLSGLHPAHRLSSRLILPQCEYGRQSHLNYCTCVCRQVHKDQMMSKSNRACFVIRTIQAIMSQEILRMVYFAYVHSIMSYGIIFWRNQPHSEKIFKIEKKVIRIIRNSRVRGYVGNCLKN